MTKTELAAELQAVRAELRQMADRVAALEARLAVHYFPQPTQQIPCPELPVRWISSTLGLSRPGFVPEVLTQEQ